VSKVRQIGRDQTFKNLSLLFGVELSKIELWNITSAGQAIECFTAVAEMTWQNFPQMILNTPRKCVR
jgi:predicted membrane protein